MNTSHSTIQEYLNTEPLHVVSLDIILNLSRDDDYANHFFEKFEEYMTERYLIEHHFTRKKVGSAIKYFSLFNEIHNIADQTIQNIKRKVSQSLISIEKDLVNTLHKCLVAEYDLLRICSNDEPVGKVPILSKAIDYLCEPDSLHTLYLEASIILKNKRIEHKNELAYTKLFFHILPWIRIFQIYDFDISEIHRRTLEDSQDFFSEIKNNFFARSIYGKELLEHLKSVKLSVVIPKLVIKTFIQSHRLGVIKDTHDYYLLVGELVLAKAIMDADVEFFKSMLLSTQSLYSIFVDLCRSEFESLSVSLPFEAHIDRNFTLNPSFTKITDYYMDKIKEEHVTQIKLGYVKSLDVIISSVNIAINGLKNSLWSRTHIDEVCNLLKRIITTNSETEECWLLNLFKQCEGLLSNSHCRFEDLEEIEGFTLNKKFGNINLYLENILDNLVEIIFNIKSELTSNKDEVQLKLNTITIEYQYVEDYLTRQFTKRLYAYTWFEDYLNVHQFTRYILWLEHLFILDKNEIEQLLIPMFARFEMLVHSSFDKPFLDALVNSENPQNLIKKQYYVFNLLRRCTLLTLTNEETEELEESRNILHKILFSNLFSFFEKFATSEVQEGKIVGHPIFGQILENCAYIFLYIYGIATLTLLDASKMTFDEDQTVRTMCNILMKLFEDDYKFYEIGCIVFEIVNNNKMIEHAFQLIPDYTEKFLLKILTNTNIHNQRVNEMFPLNDVVILIFSVLDLRTYGQSPADLEKCIEYITAYTEKSREMLDSIKNDLFSYKFSSNDQVIDHQRSQLFLYKIKSRVIYFSKVFQGIVVHIRACMHFLMIEKIDEDLERLGTCVNSILMNPVLLLVESSFRENFFQTIRTIYNTESHFQMITIDRIFHNFVSISDSLMAYLSDVQNSCSKNGLVILRALISQFNNFQSQFKPQELETFQAFDPNTLDALLQLEFIHYFFKHILEDCSVKKNALVDLSNNFGHILELTLDLEVLCKKDLMTQSINMKPENLSEIFSYNSTSLYTKVLARNIFTAVYCVPFPEISTLVVEHLTNFATKYLRFEELSTPEIKVNSLPLTKQIYAFDILLRLFPEDFSICYHRLFLSQGDNLKMMLTWIRNILLNYKLLTECYNPEVLSGFENLISQWMERIAIIIQPLYESNSEKIKDDMESLKLLREKEEEYYDSLCQLVKSDLAFFENFHAECRTLPVIFVNYYLIVKTLLQYKRYHSPGVQAPIEKSNVEKTLTRLKDKDFFETTFEKLKASLRIGLKSFYMFYLVVCYQDSLDIFSSKEATSIVHETCKGFMITGAQYTQIQDALQNLGVTEKDSDSLKYRVDLTFPYYSERWQKLLNYSEYTLRYFRKASDLGVIYQVPTKTYLDYVFAVALDFLGSFSIESFKKMTPGHNLTALSSRYRLLNFRVFLESIHRFFDLVTSGESVDQLNEYNKLIIPRIYETLLNQFRVHEAFKAEISSEGTLLKNTYEPYLLLTSLTWLDNGSEYLQRLAEDPDMIKMLINNAAIDLNMELLMYIYNIYAMNAFTASSTTQIISKSLVFSESDGNLLINSPRIELYTEILGDEVFEFLKESFNVNKIPLELLDPKDSLGVMKVTYSEESMGSAFHIPIKEYLLSGMNTITQKALEKLIQTFLEHFDREVTTIYEDLQDDPKVFRSFYMIATLLMKFPELCPFILEFNVNLKSFSFIEYHPDKASIPEEMTFLEFIIRFQTYYFPTFIHIQQAVCYNSRQPIATQAANNKITTIHESFIQEFLKEILKVLKTEVSLEGEIIETPSSVWKWRIYTRQAAQIFFSCSSFHTTAFPEAMFKEYTLFIIKCIAACYKKSSACSVELVPCLMQLFHQLLDLALIKGIDVRLQKVKLHFQSKAWAKIKGGRKFMELTEYYAKMSRDTYLKKKPHGDSSSFVKQEEAEMETLLESENVNVDYERIKGGKEEFLIIGSRVRQCNWIVTSDFDEPFKKTKENILNEYLEEVKKAYKHVETYVEKTVQDPEEKRKANLFFKTIQVIEQKNSSICQKFFEVIHSSWKNPYGTEENWRIRLPRKIADSFPDRPVFKAHQSNKLQELNKKLSRNLYKTHDHINKSKQKGTVRPHKKHIQKIVQLVQNKGPTIKKELQEVLEERLLKSVEGDDYIYNESKLREFEKDSYPGLERYMRSISEEERGAVYYLLDSDVLQTLPKAFCEKGKQIKKLVERKMSSSLTFDEDEFFVTGRVQRFNTTSIMGDEENREAEEEIFKCVQRQVTEDDTKDTMVRNVLVERTNDFASDEEDEIDQNTKHFLRMGSRELRRELTGDHDNDNDFDTDNENEEPLVFKSDYTNENAPEHRRQGRLRRASRLEPNESGQGEARDKDSEDSVSEGIDRQEASEVESGGEDENEGQEDEEDNIELDNLSFCTNSDTEEFDYETLLKVQNNDKSLWNRLYSEDIAESHVLDNFHEVIMTLPDEYISDVLAFFFNEVCYNLHSEKRTTYIHNHYRKLETLMINPANEARFLHCFTIVMNCTPNHIKLLNTNAKMSLQNYNSFMVNLVQFLNYYARENPSGFFKYKCHDLKQYDSLLNSMIDEEVLTIFSDIDDYTLISRIFSLLNLDIVSKNSLLAEKVMNLLCYLVKTAQNENFVIDIGIIEIDQLRRALASPHCTYSYVFRTRLGKVLRLLGHLPNHTQIFQGVEKRVFQQKIIYVIDNLAKKYETIRSIYSKEAEISPTKASSADFQKVIRTLHCPELDHFLEVLKCLDSHIRFSSNRMAIIEFTQEFMEYIEVRKVVSASSQILILLKKFYDSNNGNFSNCISSVSTYVWCLIYIYNLIRETKDHQTLKIRGLKSLEGQNSVDNLERDVDIEDFDDLSSDTLLDKLDGILFYIRDLINLIFESKLETIYKAPRIFEILSSNSLRRLLNINLKERVIRTYYHQTNAEIEQSVVPIEVRRDHILEDSIKALQKNYVKLKQSFTRLRVTFHKEEGIDQGGLKKEWFSLLIDNLFDPKSGLFMVSHNKRCLYPSPQSIVIPNSLKLFRIAGNIIGLSIKENIPTSISFTRSFLKLILDREPNLNDLEEIDPSLAKSLKFMIHNQISDVLEVDFTYEVDFFGTKRMVELVENGSGIMLNDENKHRYITSFLKAKLCTEIQLQAKEFKAGLFEFIPEYLLNYFLPYEFETLICGQTEIQVENLKQNVEYKGCSNSTPLIGWFWDVVREFNQEERMSLLFFITGSSSIPYSGFREFKITITKSSKDVKSLPVAHTCFSELELPNYENQSMLREKLKMAISEGKEGFYII